MTDSLLSVSALYKRFGGLVATDGVDLDIREGEIHALIGPNGAGKTTLINQLCGALKPDAGRVLFDGRDITRLSTHERARYGLVRSYQLTSVFARFTVEHNLALALLARSGAHLGFWRPLRKDQVLWEDARSIAQAIGLADRVRVPAAALAHGEQRQLDIGLALATGAHLLLLDEPMAGMSPDESQRMVSLIESLKGNATVILVEHDMDAVFRLAGRISVLVSGRIIATGPADQIRADPHVRRAYLGEEAAA